MKGDTMTMKNEYDNESVFDNMTNDELACLAQERDDAEKAGVFDDEHIYDCVDGYAKKFILHGLVMLLRTGLCKS